MEQKITLNEVRWWVSQANVDELRLLSEIVANQWKRLAAKRLRSLAPGMRVKWKHEKKGVAQVMHGVVVSFARKYVYIRTDDANPGVKGWNWKVAPTLLELE